MLACVALLAAGMAYAGHVHTKKVTRGEHTELVCQLCLQFARAAPGPLPVSSVVPTPVIRRVELPTVVLQQIAWPLARYHARAPPRA
jgi:hypothetical protein